MAHVVISPAIQVIVGARAHFLEKGARVPDGVDKDTIARLVKEKHISEVKEPKTEEKKSDEKKTVEIPEGPPKDSWTVPQLEAFAEREGIDLSGVEGNKPEKFAAIEKALADKQSS